MNQAMKIAAGAALLSLATTVTAQSQDEANTLVASATLTSNTNEAAAPARPGEYRITLNRPMRVGQKMHVHAEGSETRNVSTVTNGEKQPIEAGHVSISFDAEAEIRKVDAKGRPTHVRYRVDTCMMTIDGNGEVIAARGSKLTARRTGAKTEYAIDGRPVTPAAANALGIVISLDSTEATDDELLGTTSPRIVGESWKINVEKTAAEFLRMPNVTSGKPEISGVSTFVDVQEHQGHPCLFIQSQVMTENMVPGLDGFPPGMELKSAKMTAMFQRLFPEDVRLPSLSDFMRTDINAVLTSNTGVEMHVNGFRMAELEMTPMTRASDASGSEKAMPETSDAEMAATGEASSSPDSD